MAATDKNRRRDGCLFLFSLTGGECTILLGFLIDKERFLCYFFARGDMKTVHECRCRALGMPAISRVSGCA